MIVVLAELVDGVASTEHHLVLVPQGVAVPGAHHRVQAAAVGAPVLVQVITSQKLPTGQVEGLRRRHRRGGCTRRPAQHGVRRARRRGRGSWCGKNSPLSEILWGEGTGGRRRVQKGAGGAEGGQRRGARSLAGAGAATTKRELEPARVEASEIFFR